MARLWTSGAETGALLTEGLVLLGGTVAFDTGRVRYKGARSFDASATAAASDVYSSWTGATAIDYYARGWSYIDTLPTNNGVTVMSLATVAGVQIASLRVDANGTLSVYSDTATTVLAANVGVLTAATWHLFELHLLVPASGSVGTIECRIDGVLKYSSIANLSVGTTAPSRLLFGWVSAPGNGSAAHIHFDDLGVNDSNTGAGQTSWLGNGYVVHSLPTADSAANNWVGGAGGTTSLFDAVNNIPPVGVVSGSGTNTSQVKDIVASNTSPAADYTMTMQSYATAGVQATDTVDLVVPVLATGADSTSTTQGSADITSNPTQTQPAAASFSALLAVGTFPTNWLLYQGPLSYQPAVTIATAPVLRVSRRLATAGRNTHVCYASIQIEAHTPPRTIPCTIATNTTSTRTVTATIATVVALPTRTVTATLAAQSTLTRTVLASVATAFTPVALLQDTVQRADVGSGWGTATDLNTWVKEVSGGGVLTVAGGELKATGISANTPDMMHLGSVTAVDAEGLYRFAYGVATGEYAGIALRVTSWTSATMYVARHDDVGNFTIDKWVAGTKTNLFTSAVALTPGTFYWIRFRAQGSGLSIRWWTDGSGEPGTWNGTATDTSITAAGAMGFRVYAGNAAAIQIDSVRFTNPDQRTIPATIASSITGTRTVTATVAAIRIVTDSDTYTGTVESKQLAIIRTELDNLRDFGATNWEGSNLGLLGNWQWGGSPLLASYFYGQYLNSKVLATGVVSATVAGTLTVALAASTTYTSVTISATDRTLNAGDVYSLNYGGVHNRLITIATTQAISLTPVTVAVTSFTTGVGETYPIGTTLSGVIPPSHDIAVDMRYMVGLVRYKRAFPGDTRYDTDYANYLSILGTEWATSTDKRGWIYFYLYEIYKYSLDTNVKAAIDSMTANYNSLYDTTYNTLIGHDGTRPNGWGPVMDNLEAGLALYHYGTIFSNATYVTRGQNIINFWWTYAKITGHTLFPVQVDNLLNGAYGTGVPTYAGVTFDASYSGSPYIFQDDHSLLATSLLLAYEVTQDATLLTKAQAVLDELDTEQNSSGWWDTTLYGYFRRTLMGGTGPSSPGSLTVDTTTKNTGRMAEGLGAFVLGNKWLAGRYAIAQGKMLQVVRDFTFHPEWHGTAFEANADWSFRTNDPQVITTEATGASIINLLLATDPTVTETNDVFTSIVTQKRTVLATITVGPSRVVQTSVACSGAVQMTVGSKNSVSTVLGTAALLQAGTPANVSNVTIGNLIGTATGWDEIWPLGKASTVWAAAGAQGTPTGHGALLDGVLLDYQTFVAGTMDSTYRVRLSAGSGVTATFVRRIYKRSSGGTYTLLATLTKTGVVLTNSAVAMTGWTLVNNAGDTLFSPGDKLYIDTWANITANTQGNGSLLFNVVEADAQSIPQTFDFIQTAGFTNNITTLTRTVTATIATQTSSSRTVAATIATQIQTTALTAYGTAVAATTLPNASLIATASGGTASGKDTALGTATGISELWSRGNVGAWSALGSYPTTPGGHGILLDSTLLEGQTLVSGLQAPVLRIGYNTATADATADLTVIMWVLHADGSFTKIATITLAAQTIPFATTTTFTFPGTTVPSTVFDIGDKLYYDFYANVTSNPNTNSASKIRINFSSSGTQGVASTGALITTPGYVPATTIRTITCTLAAQATRTRTITATLPAQSTLARTITASIATYTTSTRTVTATIPALASLQRTIPATIAAQALALTRTVTATFAAQSTLARTITGTIATLLASSRTVTATIASQSTLTRTVPSTLAASNTLARTISATAAVLSTLTRTVTETLAAQSTLARTVTATISTEFVFTRTATTTVVAQSLALTRTIPANIATLATFVHTVPAAIASLSSLLRTTPASLASQSTLTRTITATIAALSAIPRTAPTTIPAQSLALSRTIPSTIPALSVLIRTVTTSIAAQSVGLARTTPATVPILTTLSRTVPATLAALAQTVSTRTVTTTLAATSSPIRTIPTTFVAAGSVARTVTTTIAVALAGTLLRSVESNVAAQSLGLTRTAPATFAMQSLGLQRTIPTSAALLSTLQHTIPASAVVQSTLSRTITVDLAAKSTLVRTVPCTLCAQSTLVRTVPSSIAALTIGVRTIPATLALIATPSHIVPATISAVPVPSSNRTFPTALAAQSLALSRALLAAIAAQSLGLTHTIPSDLAVTQTLAHTVPTSVAALSIRLNVIPASVAVVTLGATNTVPTQVVISVFNITRFVPSAISINDTRTRTVPAVLVVALAPPIIDGRVLLSESVTTSVAIGDRQTTQVVLSDMPAPTGVVTIGDSLA
jgi:hypothetical protein